MATILTINGKPVEREAPEVSEELVQLLKDTLAMAESGELQSFIGIGLTSDDGYYRMRSFDGGSKVAMYGLLHILVQDFYHTEIVEEDEDE